MYTHTYVHMYTCTTQQYHMFFVLLHRSYNEPKICRLMGYGTIGMKGKQFMIVRESSTNNFTILINNLYGKSILQESTP